MNYRLHLFLFWIDFEKIHFNPLFPNWQQAKKKKRTEMKIHTTNYKNTFIEIAEDCPVNVAEIPPIKGEKKSVANMQFEMLKKNPYKFTSDDVFFQVFADRKDVTKNEYEAERAKFFSKGQPCFRASPLTKKFGFGIHSDDNRKIAMFGAETEEYAKFIADKSIEKVKAMRSKRA